MSKQDKYGNFLKVLLSGLDNAGKSSMLVVIKKMYEFEEEVKSLKPTLRIDHYRRNFLNCQVDINDMGGQESFREKYLNREIYFEETDAFIYLIDIKDSERIPTSLDYLGQVLDILRKTKFNNEKLIHVCFTKTDRNKQYEEIPEYEKNRINAEKQIIEQFSDFKFQFYCTSIYNVYSIVQVFSNALTACVDPVDKIYAEIEKFAQQYEFENVVLFDNTGLILAEYKQIPSKFAQTAETHEVNMDMLISKNLDYFKKVEDEENPEFRFFQHIEENWINYGYNFSTEKSPEKYYISVVVSAENEKKYDWSTHEIIEKISKLLEIALM